MLADVPSVFGKRHAHICMHVYFDFQILLKLISKHLRTGTYIQQLLPCHQLTYWIVASNVTGEIYHYAHPFLEPRLVCFEQAQKLLMALVNYLECCNTFSYRVVMFNMYKPGWQVWCKRVDFCSLGVAEHHLVNSVVGSSVHPIPLEMGQHAARPLSLL